MEAQVSKTIVLAFNFDNAFVNPLVEKLKSQCPDGDIVGITTQISTSLGFFSWTNKALMQGLCVTRR